MIRMLIALAIGVLVAGLLATYGTTHSSNVKYPVRTPGETMCCG